MANKLVVNLASMALKQIKCILPPFQVVGTCFVRKGMDWLFTQYELQYLDDIMPGEDKNAKEDELKKHDDHVSKRTVKSELKFTRYGLVVYTI